MTPSEGSSLRSKARTEAVLSSFDMMKNTYFEKMMISDFD